MLGLILFLLAIYGLASALTVLKFGQYFFGTYKERKFLGRVPFFGDIFYCPPCISFYLGMAASVFILSPSRDLVPVWWKAMLLDGLAAVAFSYLAHAAAEKLTHGLDV
ncbi:MAG TPA: hypothetical protein VEN81_01345 [Planctomycetota bacterium]|nr:hypothetical protein [Planctomycetota bacterium]